MYKLEVKLKQHTPLIHFQWEHQGATLRASEVKPKLDRFVLEKLVEKKGEEYTKGKECYEREVKQSEKFNEFEALEMFEKASWIGKAYGWLIGESKALDYKMRIKSSGRGTKLDKLPMYFGGTDKKGVSYDQELDLTISSFYNEVIELLKRYLSEFFFCYNFGCRQSKGYGGFSVEKINDSVVSDNIEACLKDNFNFVYKCKSNFQNNFIQIFKKIRHDYQLIKSGINNPFNPNAYKKSKLFLFGVKKMKDKPRWEKRFIKKGIKEHTILLNNIELSYEKEPLTGNDENTNSWEDKPNFYNYKYLRALLGLTEQYEFLTKTKQDKDKVVVKLKNDSVERYKSPLLFKIINGTFYIVGNNSYPVGGKEFNMVFYIKSSKNEKKLYVTNEGVNIDTLEIPSDFSLCGFMKFVMEEPEFKEYYETIKNNT